MAHFYGTLQGARGEATRLGTKTSGMHVTACSYEGKVRVILDYDTEKDCDIARVELAKHMGAGVEHVLYDGPVGVKPGDEAMPGLIAAAKGMIHACCVAPARDPGEGYWEDIDAAFGCGQVSADYENAKIMRAFLRKVGIQPEGIEGRPLCPGCSRFADEVTEEGSHDPDCKLEQAA
jgi:hypothetical protein